ncbi:MAG: hypothetical protein WBS17_01740 [Candidatus Acidiferrales bacterium]
MAKVAFTVHPITTAIRRAEKKLRSIRPKVSKTEQKKIDLNLRMLEKSYNLLRIACPKVKVRDIQLPFGQWFTTNP